LDAEQHTSVHGQFANSAVSAGHCAPDDDATVIGDEIVDVHPDIGERLEDVREDGTNPRSGNAAAMVDDLVRPIVYGAVEIAARDRLMLMSRQCFVAALRISHQSLLRAPAA
jgi:hypothetical protein